MKEVKLASGKKAKVMEMSVDDIDYCNDIPIITYDESNNAVIRNLSKTRTAWLRKGVDKCNDKFIKSLTEEERTELFLKVQECQELGEENPSR